MDFKDRFLQLTTFLKAYQNIWQNEILHNYPVALNPYPMGWINEISQIRDENLLVLLEQKKPQGIIQNPELLAFYNKAFELESLPILKPSQKLKKRWCTFNHMIPKKRHEIENLAPLIFDLFDQNKLNKIVDIGGGIGFLAQTLAQEYDLPVHSCDMNQTFQETGIKRQIDMAPSEMHFVKFHHVFIHEKEENFLDLLDSNTLTTGLHTCGNLANDQIKSSVLKKASIINMGCCYHKLNHLEYNLSSFAKTHGLDEISNFALTLSSRGHRKFSEDDLDLKQKVKNYRYAFHIFWHDEMNQRGYATLGNSHPTLYDQDFATYVKEQLKRIEVTNTWSDDFLNSFYQNPKTQKSIQDMFSAGFIRDVFGRPLEVYLLLDRCLYLQENGYKAELFELFDETISPRNICITASADVGGEISF